MAIAAFVAAGMISSCDDSTSKPKLTDEVDTLSYALGVAQTQGLQEYLQSMDIDSTQIDVFLKGLKDGANAGDNKKETAYYTGVNIGQMLANRMMKGINRELFGDDSTKTISLQNFMNGFITGAKEKQGLMTLEQAQMVTQTKLEQIKNKNLEERFADNKKAGEKFLAENKKKEGVKTLPSGVQYRVIKEGKGAMVKDTTMCIINYEGKLIDGTVFDSSYKNGKPMNMRANQVIKGFTEALVRMPVGSTWEVYIPQELAYGNRQAGQIKPFSALIFKIELLGTGKLKK